MRTAICLAIVVAFTSCGGGSGGGGTDEFDSAEAVADSLGCSNVQPGQKAGPDESVDCDFVGDSINVGWFRSDESRDAYVQVVEQVKETMGEGTPLSPIVLGPNWAVECSQPESSVCTDEVQAKIGGELL